MQEAHSAIRPLFLHLKSVKITSTGSELQSGSLLLVTTPESDTTISQNPIMLLTELSAARNLGYSQNRMLRKAQRLVWGFLACDFTF